MPTAERAAAALPRNFIRPCILLLLKEDPAHGYDLLQRLGLLGFSGDDPGGLYRALRSLEGEELVRSAWEPSAEGPKRRVYEITRAGAEALHEHAKELLEGREAISAFLSRYEEFVTLPRPAGR